MIRCTNCTIRALSCSFIGKTGLVFGQVLPCADIKKCSNKHIMIDLGTGNNNKMCVALILYASST